MKSSYKNLDVWKKGYLLTKKIYKLTNSFPQDERYGLISQMRRASVSIVANIVEGNGRKHLKEYAQFVSIAIGSSNELEVYILLSYDLKYINENEFKELSSIQTEVSKMLFSLRKYLESSIKLGA